MGRTRTTSLALLGAAALVAGGIPAVAQSPAASMAAPMTMDELVAAAQAEGTLTTIALPDDWCNYRGVIDGMYGVLSVSERFGVSDDLRASLAHDAALFPAEAQRFAERYPGQPYRQKMAFVYQKLLATEEGGSRPWRADRLSHPTEYGSAEQFLADLRLIQASLMQHRGARMAECLRLMQALWRDEWVDFRGEFYQCVDWTSNPKPAAGTIPTWLGGESPGQLRRAGRLARAWHEDPGRAHRLRR